MLVGCSMAGVENTPSTPALAESSAPPRPSGQRQEVGEREEVPGMWEERRGGGEREGGRKNQCWAPFLCGGPTEGWGGAGGASLLGTSTEKCVTGEPP